MNNYELVKKVLEIEGYEVLTDECYGKEFVYVKVKQWCNTDSEYFDTAEKYELVGDKVKCFDLMVKYKVEMKYYNDGTIDAWITFKNQETYDDACIAILSEIAKSDNAI
jgi:hypothetical protein